MLLHTKEQTKGTFYENRMACVKVTNKIFVMTLYTHVNVKTCSKHSFSVLGTPSWFSFIRFVLLPSPFWSRVWLRLAWKFLCRLAGLTLRVLLLSLQSTESTGMCHHACLDLVFEIKKNRLSAQPSMWLVETVYWKGETEVCWNFLEGQPVQLTT